MSFELPPTNLQWLKNRVLFLTKHGSQAYGTSTPTSDTDYKGVCIPTIEYFYGYLNQFEQAEWKKTPDMVIYDIRKFFKLAADCNPSIIEVLFTDRDVHVIDTALGDKLIENRNLFISKKAKFTFSGYAVAQLKKIKTHYKWIKHPPKEKPERETFGLPPRTVIPADQLSAAQSLIRKKIESWQMPVDGLDDAAKIQFAEQLQETLVEIAGWSSLSSTDLQYQAGRALGYTDNFLEILDKERLYKNRMDEWHSYQNWLQTRNPDRSALEAKYGYDTKHGMHLVRLLRMGREIMEGKGVIVKRPDREDLLAIRNGAWTYETMVEWAEKQNADLDELYKTSTAIPKEPDRKKLDSLCLSLVEDSFSSIWRRSLHYVDP